jgi:hypothetical protein
MTIQKGETEAALIGSDADIRTSKTLATLSQPTELRDAPDEFILAEYAGLQSLRQGLVTLGENRLNFFLATVSGALVGAGLLIDKLSTYGDLVFYVVGFIFAGLLLLGIATFVRMVERSIGVVIYSRGMNRLRRYFVDKNPDIERYIIQPINDDWPSFESLGFKEKGASTIGLSEMVAALNSTIVSVIIAIGIRLFLTDSPIIVIVSGTIGFMLTLSTQILYHNSRIKEMKKKTRINFPTQ